MKWYFETCRLSHVLILGMVIWALAATVLLQELAPLAYVGLHLLTTGAFFLAFLKIDRRSQKPAQVNDQPTDESESPQDSAVHSA